MNSCPKKAVLLFTVLLIVLLAACKPLIQRQAKRPADSSLHASASFRRAVYSDQSLVPALESLKNLLKERVSKEKVPFIHPELKAVLGNPLNLELIASRLTFPVQEPKINSFRPHLAEYALDCFLGTAFPQTAIYQSEIALDHEGDISLSAYIGFITTIIKKTAFQLENAFSGLTAYEKELLISSSAGFIKDMAISDKAPGDDQSRLINLASRLRYEDMGRALEGLRWIFSIQHIETINEISRGNHISVHPDEWSHLFKGDFIFIRNTEIGLVIVGGPGPNLYAGDAAVIIDLGGNDTYLNNAGSPVYEWEGHKINRITSPVSLLIDLQGDDSYISTRLGSAGSGILGIGILMDLDGDDLYSGSILSQGSGYLGIGCLLDMGGRDRYTVEEVGQGAAFFGYGLLFDSNGDDKYAGAKFVQGFGGPGGFGLLIDASGDDLYRAGVKHGSTYGTRDVFHSVAQGAGWGLRGKSAGGIGVLQDLSGDDIYIAGNFSQGTGYYLGLGILRDLNGNDLYSGSRYCQGSAAHLAAGIIIDYRGDDSYIARIAAGQGGAWDLALAMAVDYEGDDRYAGGDLSLGAAAQNAIGLFYDGSGTDRYRANPKGFGFGGELAYDGGRGAANLGVFLDVGGSNDLYETEGLENNVYVKRGIEGLFIDE
ncbi:MAG: hypothetical protein C4582_13750 [Desulfobacteraceae bacterium]|nr:MAG: hypothetical protein C4582_13750 [Desulfobacteraceae bacterium]